MCQWSIFGETIKISSRRRAFRMALCPIRTPQVQTAKSFCALCGNKNGKCAFSLPNNVNYSFKREPN
jgi:hypothetical protein